MHSEDDEAVSAALMLESLVRYRRVVGACGFAVAVLVAVVAFFMPRQYAVEASFLPQARRANSALAGLAAQLGVGMPATETGANPQFYADLMRSTEILGAIVDQTFTVGLGGDTAGRLLTDLLQVTGDSPADRRDKAIRRLRRMVTSAVSQRTGLVSVSVRARSPELALAITERLLAELDRFNQGTRQSQAAAERRFTERRLAEARGELTAAETQLERFIQRNRDLRASPELQFVQNRLEREVGLRQQLYSSLAEAFEQARIEEVRDTPVFTIVDRPSLPPRPESRGVIRGGVVGGLVGVLLGVLLAMLHRSVTDTRAKSPDRLAALASLGRKRWIATLFRWLLREA